MLNENFYFAVFMLTFLNVHMNILHTRIHIHKYIWDYIQRTSIIFLKQVSYSRLVCEKLTCKSVIQTYLPPYVHSIYICMLFVDSKSESESEFEFEFIDRRSCLRSASTCTAKYATRNQQSHKSKITQSGDNNNLYLIT